MNKIIKIGYLGDSKCYLNIEKDEAIERYCISEGYTIEEFKKDSGLDLKIIEFDDEFSCYDIWK